ncbi:MobF family relaxase [Streptomyces sp. NPDC044571]|uniref:MobF family relaxase n=1 Tax=Streptomyces sp. NPDC044571 TaxID=3155371 RepID=UPI0033C4AEB5
MGYATPIYARAQVDYRLAEDCGCDRAEDAQVEQRLAGQSTLRWIGSGLAELGLAPGDPVDPDIAHAVMDGRDWRTGARLVVRKQELEPRGKVVARVLLDAVNSEAAAAGMSAAAYLGRPALAKRFERAERGLRRDGERHLIPVADAERLAAAAGLSLAGLYGEGTVAEARRWMHHHIEVGLRGVDITLDLPKSVSAVYGLAGPELAAAMEEDWLASVGEAAAALEEWTAYGMTGHHGDGAQAQRIATSGLIGWTTLHRSARPVDGSPGDPHLHVHVNIAHMARCADGAWRTIASGAEDLHRYAHLTNEVAEGRLRARLIERYGARFVRSARTGAWELAGVGEELCTAFSRRHRQVVAVAGEGASREQQKAAARATAESKEETAPGAPREGWRARAAALLGGAGAVDAMVAAALPAWGGPASDPYAPISGGPRMPGPEEIAAQIWDVERGLAVGRRAVSHVHVMAAVAQTLPLLGSVAELAALTDEVLAVRGHAVRLTDSPRGHRTHRQRYTHGTVVAAERAVTGCATAGLARGLARVTAQAAEMAVAAVEVANSTTHRPFVFSAEQRAVIMRLLTAGHAVDAVVGVPGAGKTVLLEAARAAWEAAGLRVAGASVAVVGTANLAAETGIASRTISAWTHDISKGRGLHGVGVLVIDEASMVNDRALAVLLEHAASTGTKVVVIGDLLQGRAGRAGGAFARIHEVVGGLQLTENRRQRDVVERAALQDWSDGGRTTALAAFARHGRVHAADTATDALTALLGAWNTVRARWEGDPHGQLGGLLMLAARRADVAALNEGARAALVAAGELARGRTYAVVGGERRSFAPGDLVHVHRNDYRTRRGGAVDALNGFRGVVLDVRDNHGVLVQGRRRRPSGGFALHEAWVDPRDIAAGRLTHAYAMTIASAQGLTAEVTLAYGLHADSHRVYTALSRARQESHLYLPLNELEDHPTRARLGRVRTDAERVERAVAAYGRLLATDSDDFMVTKELAWPQKLPAAGNQLEGLRTPGVTGGLPAVPPWTERPYGHVATGNLLRYAEAAEQAARQAADRATHYEEQAADLAAVLDTDRAPGRAMYGRLVDRLNLVEQRLLRADQAEEQAAVLEKRMAALYEANGTEARLEAKARARAALKRSALTFQRSGLLEAADALAGRITERTVEIQALTQKRTLLRGEARQLREQAREQLAHMAGRGVTSAAVAQTIADLRAGLPATLARLEQADADRCAELTRSVRVERGTEARRTAEAAGLREEAMTRAGLAPHANAVEDAGRAAAAQQRVASALADGAPTPTPRTPPWAGPSRGGGGFGR